MVGLPGHINSGCLIANSLFPFIIMIKLIIILPIPNGKVNPLKKIQATNADKYPIHV